MMAINMLGVVAALTAFVGIWMGHVAVRKVEFLSPTIWLPSVLFAGAGLALETGSLLTTSKPLSLSLGILGITMLWDALEMTRQQHRIRRGHAPANPNNPRHIRILAECPSATKVDLLKREPAGHTVTAEEALQLLEQRR